MILSYSFGGSALYVGPGRAQIHTRVTTRSSGPLAAAYVVGDEGSWITDPASVVGQIGGTFDLPTVLGIRETGGPTLLTLATINDTTLLQRIGTTIVGTTKVSAGLVQYEYQLLSNSIFVLTPSATWTPASFPVPGGIVITTNLRLMFSWAAAPIGAVSARWRLQDVTNTVTLLSGSHAVGGFIRTLITDTSAVSGISGSAAEIQFEVSFSGLDAGSITLYGPPVWHGY